MLKLRQGLKSGIRKYVRKMELPYINEVDLFKFENNKFESDEVYKTEKPAAIIEVLKSKRASFDAEFTVNINLLFETKDELVVDEMIDEIEDHIADYINENPHFESDRYSYIVEVSNDFYMDSEYIYADEAVIIFNILLTIKLGAQL